MEPRKQAICEALSRFIRQRPGLEFGNYGDVKAYRSESRSIQRDGREAETLLCAVMSHDSITADDLVKAAQGAYSGRLTITLHTDCDYSECRTPLCKIDYVTGQYMPTEYRKAVCAVLASALWEYTREKVMPEPRFVQHGSADSLPMYTERVYGPGDLSAGDWLRAHFRRELGRGIASRWFS